MVRSIAFRNEAQSCDVKPLENLLLWLGGKSSVGLWLEEPLRGCLVHLGASVKPRQSLN